MKRSREGGRKGKVQSGKESDNNMMIMEVKIAGPEGDGELASEGHGKFEEWCNRLKGTKTTNTSRLTARSLWSE